MSRLITDVGLLPLTISLTASSVTLFGMGVLELVGPVAIVRNKLGPLNLKKNDKIRIWAAFFKKVAPVVVGSAITVTISSTYMALRTINPEISKFAWTSALSAISIIPYTLLVLGSTNSSLLALNAEAENRELTDKEGQEVDRLIEKWSVLHPPRFLAYFTAWASSLAALAVGVYGIKV